MKTTWTTGLKRSMVIAAVAATGLGWSAGASARTVDNGLSLNGLSINGLSINGLSINGRETGTASIRIESMVLPDGTSIPLR
jgi:hypothetical protein